MAAVHACLFLFACAVLSVVAVHSSISEKKACPCSDPYIYTMMAVFGNLTLDPQVWWGGEGGRGDVFAASANARL